MPRNRAATEDSIHTLSLSGLGTLTNPSSRVPKDLPGGATHSPIMPSGKPRQSRVALNTRRVTGSPAPSTNSPEPETTRVQLPVVKVSSTEETHPASLSPLPLRWTTSADTEEKVKTPAPVRNSPLGESHSLSQAREPPRAELLPANTRRTAIMNLTSRIFRTSLRKPRHESTPFFPRDQGGPALIHGNHRAFRSSRKATFHEGLL